MDAASLPCRFCETPIPATAINQLAMVAHCPACDSLYSISDADLKAPDAQSSPALRIAVPVNVQLEQRGKDLHISYRMWGAAVRNTVIQAIFWDIVAIGWILVALSEDNIVMSLWSAAFVFLALSLTYRALVNSLNHTSLIINPQEILVRQGPVPVWGGTLRLDRRGVEQVWCTQRLAYLVNKTPIYVFPIMLRLKGGRELSLIGNVPDLQQALYLEQQIEKAWAIADEPVTESL